MTEADRGRAYARAWRLRNGPAFDALYGEDPSSQRAWEPGQKAAWDEFEKARAFSSPSSRLAA